MLDDVPDQDFRRHSYYALSLVFHTHAPMFFTARLWQDRDGPWRGRVDTWLDEDLAGASASQRLELDEIVFDPDDASNGRRLEFVLTYDRSDLKDHFRFIQLEGEWYGTRTHGTFPAIETDLASAAVTFIRPALLSRDILTRKFNDLPVRGDGKDELDAVRAQLRALARQDPS